MFLIFCPIISLEDLGTNDLEESREEPSTFQDSYNDVDVDHLLNNFQLVRAHKHTHTHPAILLFYINSLFFPASLRRYPCARDSTESSSLSHPFQTHNTATDKKINTAIHLLTPHRFTLYTQIHIGTLHITQVCEEDSKENGVLRQFAVSFQPEPVNKPVFC